MISANEKGRRAVASDRIINKLEQMKTIAKENKSETITTDELLIILTHIQRAIHNELAI